MILEVNKFVFVNKNDAELLKQDNIDTDLINQDEVVLKNLITTISNGTEKSLITGQRTGNGSTSFPRYPGYSNASKVIAIGKDVKSVKVGDRVISIGGNHANYHINKEDNLFVIPKEISNQEAALLYIASFSLAAIRKVRLEIGENCAVIGLGVLGQFAIQFAKAAGAYPVIGVDPNLNRRKEALANGADFVFDPTDPNYKRKVLKVAKDGYITAIEVTGNGVALNQTLELMKKFGRVALLGCTRDSDFTVDYYARVHLPGIELIGAHTLARPEKESYPHYFTTKDDIRTIANLIIGKRLNIKNMIKETHSPNECHEIYKRLVEEKDFPIVVQFDWSLLK